MSVDALAVLQVARSINQGAILVEELIELSHNKDATEQDAEALVDRNIEAMIELQENDVITTEI